MIDYWLRRGVAANHHRHPHRFGRGLVDIGGRRAGGPGQGRGLRVRRELRRDHGRGSMAFEARARRAAPRRRQGLRLRDHADADLSRARAARRRGGA